MLTHDPRLPVIRVTGDVPEDLAASLDLLGFVEEAGARVLRRRPGTHREFAIAYQKLDEWRLRGLVVEVVGGR